MKTTIIGLSLLALGGFVPSILCARSNDPCESRGSNLEMRECYTNEQRRVNAEADSLAKKVAADFRKEAQDPTDGQAAIAIKKAATAVLRSQIAWRAYRDQHCRTVELSWTTGSGAGTAYEQCMFELGKERLHDLQGFLQPAP